MMHTGDPHVGETWVDRPVERRYLEGHPTDELEREVVWQHGGEREANVVAIFMGRVSFKLTTRPRDVAEAALLGTARPADDELPLEEFRRRFPVKLAATRRGPWRPRTRPWDE